MLLQMHYSEKVLQYEVLLVRIWLNRGLPMAKAVGNNKKDGKTAASTAVSNYVGSLSQEQRMLVTLKSQLYGGKWEPMLDDLENRLSGKPYIFKLASRIQDDIERIKQMAEFESRYDIDLAELVDLS